MEERKKCPFYGYHLATVGIFIHQNGNQCALKPGYSPCQMEINNQKVNYSLCEFAKTQGEAIEILKQNDALVEVVHRNKTTSLEEWLNELQINL